MILVQRELLEYRSTSAQIYITIEQAMLMEDALSECNSQLTRRQTRRGEFLGRRQTVQHSSLEHHCMRTQTPVHLLNAYPNASASAVAQSMPVPDSSILQREASREETWKEGGMDDMERGSLARRQAGRWARGRADGQAGRRTDGHAPIHT